MASEETQLLDLIMDGCMSSVDNRKKAGDLHLARKRKLIYEKGSDFKLIFENGEFINVNKAVLAMESEYFDDILFGSPNSNFEIKDFDRETFQTFLDCLFGFKDCSVLDALMIYPIAHKYCVEKCLTKCILVLKPSEMNENVCSSLNLAVFYDCNELINDIITFFISQIGVVTVIENKIYSDLLKPQTMSELINHVKLNSYVWSLIYDWAIRHLESQSNGQDIRSFLAENKILEKILLTHFESVQSIFNFHKMTDRKLLDYKNLTKDINGKLPERSSWVVLAAGEEIKEVLLFKNSLVVSAKDFMVYRSNLNLNINPMYLVTPKILFSNSPVLNCKVRLNFQRTFSKSEGVSSFENNIEGTLNHAIPQSCTSFQDVQANFLPSQNTICLPIRLMELMEIKSVELTYKFLHHIRILKTSISGNFLNSNDLYFTKDIGIKRINNQII